MLRDLLADLKLDGLDSVRHIEKGDIVWAVSQIEAEPLRVIIRKYVGLHDMSNGLDIHTRHKNVRLLLDINLAVDRGPPGVGGNLYEQLLDTDPLFVRLLVEAFHSWVQRTQTMRV